jgi:TATA-binding protein-associated factor Taf7
VIEDATFDLDLDEYFVVAEKINRDQLSDYGAPKEFLKRENLPREEDFGIATGNNDDSLDILDQLEKNMFEEETQTAQIEEPNEASQAKNHEETIEKEGDDHEQKEEDVNDLLDELIDS